MIRIHDGMPLNQFILKCKKDITKVNKQQMLKLFLRDLKVLKYST